MANQKRKSCPFNPYKHKGHFARHLVTTVILVIITFLAGLYLAGTGVFSPFGQVSIAPGAEQPAKKAVKKGSYEQGYQEALDFARSKLYEKGKFKLPSSLTATVKSASGQNVVIEFDADRLDPFAEGMATKTVVVGSETQLYERVPKDEEQLEKEYKEFEKAMKAFEVAYAANPDAEGLQEPQEPQEYDVKTLAVSDLQPGDRVRVRVKIEETEEGEVISPFASDFVEATEIRLLSRPEPEPEEPTPTEIGEPTDVGFEEPIEEPIE